MKIYVENSLHNIHSKYNLFFDLFVKILNYYKLSSFYFIEINIENNVFYKMHIYLIIKINITRKKYNYTFYISNIFLHNRINRITYNKFRKYCRYFFILFVNFI